ncbi:hypothetical protein F511_02761 [Dorcoceras hygrometricum]|uniref:Uncharacterized protein n=1 Tax=Dorcoceras hygrometricum TaxID=472368 RepID=A0A2Z7DEA9_9LAMI|nr:hypothetical protein F511_02761 [Dorcoceras hygrometricum]
MARVYASNTTCLAILFAMAFIASNIEKCESARHMLWLWPGLPATPSIFPLPTIPTISPIPSIPSIPVYIPKFFPFFAPPPPPT